MGTSGLPDLRELAMLGFGTFSETVLGQVGVNNSWNSYNIDLPSGAAGSQKVFQLIGYLKQEDAPPGLCYYRVAHGNLPAQSSVGAIIMDGSQEPIMRFISPEQPRLVISLVNVTSRYLDAYVVSANVYVGILTGQAEQLEKLIEFLSNKMAPPSLIEDAIASASSLAPSAPSGDYY